MSRKEIIQKAKGLHLLLPACLAGMVLTLCAMLCIAMLMQRGVLGAGEFGIYSKLSLAVGCCSAAAYICLRAERDRLLMSVLADALVLLFMLCFSMLCGAGECNYVDIVFELALAVISAMLVCTVAAKRTKRRKIKKVHK